MSKAELENLSNEELLAELKRRLQEGGVEEFREFQELEDQLNMVSKKLREAEQGKSDFLSNVRNEVNNPLTSILGLSNSIVNMTEDTRVKHLSELIHQQAFELDYQMRNIITAAEIELGAVKPLASKANIRSLIESQIEYIAPRLAACSVAIELDIPNEIQFTTDASILQTIFLNLLANAVEFSEPQGKVWVKAVAESDALVLVVQDFGKGIDAAQQKFVFDRFRQLDAGAAKAHHGQGLGLAIVEELTTLLGGGTILDSVINKGTTVTVRIPELTTENLSSDTSFFGNEILFDASEEF
ncbi:MAG TPA: HAMP domain-containing sensor histidine kinase [Ohtaekwangia sp.]|uniref:sensor histidine kinase n=1 Tax=Ohtaekwangia sp. TaxID=2066019 RepID=UPI002F93D556